MSSAINPAIVQILFGSIACGVGVAVASGSIWGGAAAGFGVMTAAFGAATLAVKFHPNA